MTLIKAPYIYKVKCNTCNSFIDKEGLLPDYTCPIGVEHIVEPIVVSHYEDQGMQGSAQKDYKRHRKELMAGFIGGSISPTPSNLLYASAHFCTPKEVRDQFFTIEEQIILGKEFNRRSIEARLNRWNTATVELYNRLTLQEAFEIGQVIDTLAFRYLNYGIEGTSEGDPIGIFDYFMGTSGTIYETNNFISTNYIPIGMTLIELKDKVLDIVVSGNY